MQKMTFVARPEDAGVSSKGLLRFLDAVEAQEGEFHSFLVLKGGKVACKMNWAPYDEKTPHILFSLSKSFCSAAVGFAVSEGKLHWDDKVADVLSDCVPEKPDRYIRDIRLSDLLSMSSGLEEKSDCVPEKEKEWAKYILACKTPYPPHTHFHYNSHGTYLCSMMVQRAVGMTVRDYLLPRLFDKLGIEKPEWDKSPEGVCCGGWGLHLSAEDIAKFGLCLQNHGMWEGQRVLPEGWVENASLCHMFNFAGDPYSDWQQGYGYQFWRTRGGRYRGDGMYGQVCMVDEGRRMVVACTAGLNDMGREMNLLNDFLFPAGSMEDGTEEEILRLQARLQALSYPPAQDDGTGYALKGVPVLSKKARVLLTQESPTTLRVQITSLEEGNFLSVQSEITLLAGLAKYLPGEIPDSTSGAKPLRTLSSYGWEKGRLHVVSRTPDGPFLTDFSVSFDENGKPVQVEDHGVGVTIK